MSTTRPQPDTGTAPTIYPQARHPLPKPQITLSPPTPEAIARDRQTPAQQNNPKEEFLGTSRGSASPNPPDTSTQISSNHPQLSSHPVQPDHKSRDWNDAILLNQGHQQQPNTFTGQSERNDHRAETQRTAAEASFAPAPTGSQKKQNSFFYQEKFQDAQGSLVDPARNYGKDPRTKEYASQAPPSKDKLAKMGQHGKTVKSDPNDDHATPPSRLRVNSVFTQGANFGLPNTRKTQPDSDDERRSINTLLTNVAVHQRPEADFPQLDSASKFLSQASFVLRPACRNNMVSAGETPSSRCRHPSPVVSSSPKFVFEALGDFLQDDDHWALDLDLDLDLGHHSPQFDEDHPEATKETRSTCAPPAFSATSLRPHR